MVTGAAGQLGTDVVKRFEAEGGHEVVAVDLVDFDITQRDAVVGAVRHAKPDVILHGAAYTAVDKCETEIETAYNVNVMSVRHFAEAARDTGAHLLYVSTDYVFDGTKDSPYHEWDTPNPQSVYGQTKLAGERELGPDATIMRTSWVCGEYGNNIVKTILRLLDGEDDLQFVDDQRGHPSFCADLAKMMFTLATEKRPGTFHVTNQGAVSWYEFTQEVAKAAGHDPARVHPITTADMPLPAPRPANSVLENRALALSGIELLPDFRGPLNDLVGKLTSSG
ncbi:MAG: dTDP-4-dehydrorhamnose reductase [Acidimicrobiales bacterium]|nr:dTDP-4-dehydrorhamnose reductase [Acidimicrobiales bacterium]